jgi:hypothetical protein
MKKSIFLLLCGIFFTTFAYAEPQDIQLFWNYDNDSYDDAIGFKVYMRDPESSDYPNTPYATIDRDDACQAGRGGDCCILETIDGQHLFVVTAYNEHAESSTSNEVEYIPYELLPPTSVKIRFTWEIPAN